MATFLEAIETAQAVYLNDAAKKVYTDARLFIVAKEAYRTLKRQLGLQDDQLFREIQVASYTANATTLSFVTDNLAKPVMLEERDSSSTSEADYKPVKEEMWELGRDKAITEDLRYWSWRENSIHLLPATSNRSVRVYYDKSLADPATSAVDIAVTRGEEYLAPQIAALASAFIGNNPERASACYNAATSALENILGLSAKSGQGLVTKRKPYRGRRPVFVHSR